tara:strand:+ start:157 stop:522 length:366 start_codon:yes stop_codon:yes gene_type:complete
LESEKIDLIIVISLIISMMINGLLVWYAIKVLEKLSYVYDNISAMQEINNSFVEHLESVHEMEMYYGDPTLGALIKHSQLIVEQYATFNEILEDLADGIISVQEDVIEEPQEETDGEKEIG